MPSWVLKVLEVSIHIEWISVGRSFFLEIGVLDHL